MKTVVAPVLAIATFATAIEFALPGQAATLTPFSFKTNVTASPAPAGSNLLNDPTKDIRLDSVVANGKTINQFELVNQARILLNDNYVNPSDGSIFGVLNSGRGPNTAADNAVAEGPSKPNPTNQDIVSSLGNLNLNSLLVTRENANIASIEVSFANPVTTFFFWERGGTAGGAVAGDSDLLVEALSPANVVVATYKILRSNYTKADYNISSEVAPILNNGPFNIGAIGLQLNGIATQTLRLTSFNNNGAIVGVPNDNGPDFKVVAAAEAVPEPFTIAGTLVAGGLGVLLKQRKPTTAVNSSPQRSSL